jgi:thymidylate synthase
MLAPVLANPVRKLSYSFAAAEALWILSGSDSVEEVARYVPRLREFSDDGKTLAGAYGPRIVNQLPYVVAKLKEDPNSRQAVMTIWRANPAPSKDIPCTVALAFQVRLERIDCHAFMRSSDLWLGWPYDVFTFSMVSLRVALDLNLGTNNNYSLGNLYLTAASSHLYEENARDARRCLEWSRNFYGGMTVPFFLFDGKAQRYLDLETSLTACRDRLEDSIQPPWLIRPWYRSTAKEEGASKKETEQ